MTFDAVYQVLYGQFPPNLSSLYETPKSDAAFLNISVTISLPELLCVAVRELAVREVVLAVNVVVSELVAASASGDIIVNVDKPIINAITKADILLKREISARGTF